MTSVETTGVQNFYQNRGIFITGVTGFVGKVLLEKLLRTCDVQKIFVLMRPKRNLEPKERKEALFKSKMFENLKESKPHVFSKVHCVEGNLVEENLGMNVKDITTLTENVSIVFHLAASLKFEEPLRDSFRSNVKVTKNVADFSRRIRHLVSFVHVSTAYCNCEKSEVEEKVYPLSSTYDSVLKLLESNDDRFIDKIMPTLCEGRPNVYTLTKAIAENMLAETYHDLPLVIVRPSIITSSWKEPLPGWTDSINGATGLFVGSMKGIIKTGVIHGEKLTDFIAVDIVVNMLIVAAWNMGKREKSSSKEVEVYHCTSGIEKPVTWNNLFINLNRLIWLYPSERVFIYPSGRYTRSYQWNNICTLFEHYFPAIIVDFLMLLSGRRPKLMTIYKKVHKAMNAFQYFGIREWKFHSSNRCHLLETMSIEDRKNFKIDVANIDMEDYLKNYILGVRRYILKEDDSTIPVAKRKLIRNFIIARVFQIFIIIFLVYCFITSPFVKMLLN